MNFAQPTATWAPAVAAFLGLFVGVMAATFGTRRLGPAAHATMRRRDAQAELTLAVDNLRELTEREASLRPGEGARERARLEARAEAALATLQALAAPAPASAPNAGAAATARPARSPAVGYLAARPRLQGALWGTGLMTVALFLWTTVQQGATPVPSPVARAPFAAAGGGAPAAGEGVDPAELEALQQTLAKDANDVAALVRLAHLALRAQQLEQADKLTAHALTLAPDNVEAQVHAAVVLAGQGEGGRADVALGAVLRAHPEFAEAWFFRGMLSMQAGQMDAMREAFTQFVRVAPEGAQKERIKAMLQR